MKPSEARVLLPPELVAVEHVLEVAKQLQELAQLSGELKPELQRAQQQLEAVVALLEEPPVGSVRPLLRSRIERLGLANEVLRLREAGYTYQEIADRYRAEGLTADLVGRFCRGYDRLQAAERLRVRRQSIFETQQRLEDISSMLYRLIARLEVEHNDETLVKAIGELRQTAALAQQVMKDMVTYAQYQQFKQAVLALIAEYVPAERRGELAQRIAEQRLLQNSLSP
jgi:hypothetical protein